MGNEDLSTVSGWLAETAPTVLQCCFWEGISAEVDAVASGHGLCKPVDKDMALTFSHCSGTKRVSTETSQEAP